MATINVRNATGEIEAIEKPLPPSRAAAAASRPVALSTEDKAALDALATGAKQDTGNATLASILDKLPSSPATTAGQAAIIAAIEEIPGGGGSGGDRVCYRFLERGEIERGAAAVRQIGDWRAVDRSHYCVVAREYRQLHLLSVLRRS